MMSSWIFKVIVAGAGGVGKTAMVTRYCTGKFEDGYKMTIGAGFHTKSEILDTGESVKMQLWDFAGEKRFRELLPDYCKGASGGLICFDITDYDTFRDIPVWLKIIRQKAGFVPIILMGMKWDLSNHEVDFDVADEQQIIISNDRRKWGKIVTVIKFEGNIDANLKDILKKAKKKCASGGALRGKEIELQGEHKLKLKDF
ncbi:unnamed protein product [marine sediment metagenome]|uniref:SUI1 domain-containing protein n=1 Tax=marine sediment metagenome TaxID=412755 RepID=X1CZD4_9ZZZZ